MGFVQLGLFVLVLTALTPPLGRYLAWVFGRPPPASWPAQDWRGYARSVLTFSAACLIALYVTMRMAGQDWALAFNTAISFVSNTSWQFYGGESTLTPLAQMIGIGAHSFLGAGVGLAVGVAVIRGFTGRSARALGNFWHDLIRGLGFVLLPICALSALILVSQGTVQTLDAGLAATTVTGGAQELVTGPVASQVAIKTLGSVGGGYFNVNSAMPFENPGGLSSFLQALLIVLGPAGLTALFGRWAGDRRQGWLLYGVVLVLFVGVALVTQAAEDVPTQVQQAAGIGGANLEGKEVRYDAAGTALYAAATTTGASGAVNGAMESLSGLGASAPYLAMATGEVIFGGIGSGMTGLLAIVVLSVFLAGLMIGRTPEYLGKKLGSREIRLAVLISIAAPLVALAATAIAVATPIGRASMAAGAPGSEQFSEALWAYTSQAMNNGSAFAGYAALTTSELGGGLAMLAGRYLPLVLALALAGAIASGRTWERGTLQTHSPLFGSVVLFVIVVVAALTFLPALFLGPVAEALTGS